MGNSIENQGFSTFLQHLLAIKQKSVMGVLAVVKIDSESCGGDFQVRWTSEKLHELNAIGTLLYQIKPVFYRVLILGSSKDPLPERVHGCQEGAGVGDRRSQF
jgi:hypothetical protein